MDELEKPKRGLFYRLRVAFLLVVLAGVLIYAYEDIHSRHARTEWKRTVEVAFVIVRAGSITDASVHSLENRIPDLEKRLAEEMGRYQKTSIQPFHVSVFGPIDDVGPPPEAPSEPGIVATIRYQWALDRWVSAVDSRGGYRAKDYDTRIYLEARPPKGTEREEIEGASEEGGRKGVVRVELDESMADFTLFVATHEMLHTLGATDKYAPDGSVLVPGGLAEPDLKPLYPQRFAEVMARHRPTSPTESKPPASLAQLAIGAKTAEEIGWIIMRAP